MGEYFCLLNPGNKKQRNGQKLLIVLFQASYVKLIEKDNNVSAEGTCVQCGSIVVVFGTRLSGLNADEDLFLIRTVDVPVIKVRYVNSSYQKRVPVHLSR